MLYKPNFCCHCGEKIERREWNLLTSRRFCEVCSAEYKRHELLPRAITVAGVLAIAFGIGSMFGSSGAANQQMRGYREPAPMDSERISKRNQVSSDNSSGTDQNIPEKIVPQAQTSPESPVAGTVPPGDKQFALRKEQTQERIYFCGALTKKGTSCSRRVKKQGAHCWQHEGAPRLLPEN